MCLWEQGNWPHFEWDEPALRPTLDAVRFLLGRVSGRTEAAPEKAELDVEMDALIQNAIRTSEIEGERLDVGSVRSSVARQLGLAKSRVNPRPIGRGYKREPRSGAIQAWPDSEHTRVASQ